MAPQDVIEQALYDLLRLDATLQGLVGNPARVFRAIAPRETAYPIIIYDQAKSNDRYVFTRRAASSFYYLVKCIDRADSALNAVAAAERIDALIDRASLNFGATYGNQAQNVIARDTAVSYPEPFADQTYWHEGGVYRIDVQG